ncbi:MAG: hypothetical protein KA956_07530 [Pyrinomonadaceae bacterium]|nr:hypothetical protein [Acidobacteriota bacterium]MBP7376312.1 hypothetical protein [Pyrinomonadaceae bacterium]
MSDDANSINSGPWLQHVSQRLMSNGYKPMRPEAYQPLGFRFAVNRSGLEISKFGMVDRTFVFADIPSLDVPKLQQFSKAAFEFANKNKTVSLPNGLFSCLFCFGVSVTVNADPALVHTLTASQPISHFGAFEMPVIFDLANGGLYYYQTTPIWGAAYHSSFRREVQTNLGP